MMKSTKSVERGFTLIELMIVVAIIGILAAVAVPKFAEMIRKSKEGASKGSLSALRSALTIYSSDNEGLAPIQDVGVGAAFAINANVNQNLAKIGMATAMIPKYIESWPSCKLGTYHPDTNNVEVAISSAANVKNPSWIMNQHGQNQFAALNEFEGGAGDHNDINGWVYVTNFGGSFFVNCGHTDTKGTTVSEW